MVSLSKLELSFYCLTNDIVTQNKPTLYHLVGLYRLTIFRRPFLIVMLDIYLRRGLSMKSMRRILLTRQYPSNSFRSSFGGEQL